MKFIELNRWRRNGIERAGCACSNRMGPALGDERLLGARTVPFRWITGLNSEFLLHPYVLALIKTYHSPVKHPFQVMLDHHLLPDPHPLVN